jgi:hypothetical protein
MILYRFSCSICGFAPLQELDLSLASKLAVEVTPDTNDFARLQTLNEDE